MSKPKRKPRRRIPRRTSLSQSLARLPKRLKTMKRSNQPKSSPKKIKVKKIPICLTSKMKMTRNSKRLRRILVTSTRKNSKTKRREM